MDSTRIKQVMIELNQWGVGIEGGAEAMVHTAKNIEDLHGSSQLSVSLAKVQVDWDNCFGKFDQSYIRECIKQELPEHEASIAWKHQQESKVTHHFGEGLFDTFVKNRGAEQGDAGAALEAGVSCSVAVRDATQDVHQVLSGTESSWCSLDERMCADDSSPADPSTCFRDRMEKLRTWQTLEPGWRYNEDGNRMPHPLAGTQYGGGIVEVSYLDDGWAWMRSDLVVPWLKALDNRIGQTGGSRNRQKTRVIFYTDERELHWDSSLSQESLLAHRRLQAVALSP